MEDEEEMEVCKFDMQQQMYMMLMGSMKRFYQEDNEVHGTLDSRALLYLCDAVDRARDQLASASKKIFKTQTHHRPGAHTKQRRLTLTPMANINIDDGKEHIEPLTAFWERLKRVLKLRSVKDHSSCCYKWSFENVQCSIQALNSVMQTTSKIHDFLHESLIPMQTNTQETRRRLRSIENQLTEINQDAKIYIELIEEDYEQDVRVAKSIIVARQIIRHCSAEVDKLYSHGIFDSHVKDELKEHLLGREMKLLYYGDCWVMLRPC